MTDLFDATGTLGCTQTTATSRKHILPDIGLPYAVVSVVRSKAAVRCPVCGELFIAKRAKSERVQYQEHFTDKAARGE